MAEVASVVRTTTKNPSGGFIRAAYEIGDTTEACPMEPSQDYVIAPDGEIVKVSDGNYEYTGMYVVD